MFFAYGTHMVSGHAIRSGTTSLAVGTGGLSEAAKEATAISVNFRLTLT